MNYPAPAPKMIAARHKGGRQTPRAIVIHATVSPDNPGTAEAIAKWWAGPNSPVTSAHYVRDPKVTFQCVGDHTVAYHCGSNQDTIGYELCDEQIGAASRWKDADSQAIIRGAARDVAQLCLAYKIQPIRPTVAQLRAKGKHGIYGHDDSRRAFGRTTHTDPRDFPWDQFLALVRQQIDAIKKAAAGGPNYPKLAAADFAVWNAKVGDRPTFGAELEAVMNGRRFGAILETGGNRDVIREYAGDMKYSIFTGKGDVGASTMILAKHGSGITRHGLIDVDTVWWGPKGKAIPGRAFPWFRWVEDGRPSMFIAPHMPWGPTRPRNVKAWVDCSKMLRHYAAVSTGYDLLIAGDLNQLASVRLPYSIRGTATAIGAQIITTGEPLDYALWRPATRPVPAAAKRPVPKVRATTSDAYEGDHPAVAYSIGAAA